jgi:hypothetical protein
MSSGISFDQFEPEDVGGFDSVQPGSYHCQIAKVVPEDEKGKLVVSFEILRGTTPGQVTKVHTERFGNELKKVPQKKRAALALATKIVTMEQAKAAKAAGQELIPDWVTMTGRQVCLNLVRSEDGKYTNLNWDEVWAPDDKKAYHVPLNRGMLDYGKITLPPDRPLDGIQVGLPSKQKTEEKPAATDADAASLLSGVV